MNVKTYKRGDLSEDGTKRFWGYQSYIRKDGTRSESWIPTNQFQQKWERDRIIGKVADYRRHQREILK